MVCNRFLKYIAFDTQSDHKSETCPSTQKQMAFAQALAEECRGIGFNSVQLTKDGYVYCYLKGTSEVKSLGFIAHMDTSPDCKGAGVKPQIIRDYRGGDIKLKEGVILSPSKFQALNLYIGGDIITTDGNTLLGADDKAGIAEIITAMEYIIKTDRPHPDIYVAFTPDEEIGRGMDKFDLNLFKANYAFTVDGGQLGELEYECFNGARALLKIYGESVHPGSAKGVMKNAALIASQFVCALPEKESPAETDGYEGFYHINSIEAKVEYAEVSLIIRDFKRAKLEERKGRLYSIVEKLSKGRAIRTALTINDEYYNMAEVISNHMWLIETAAEAYARCGIEPVTKPIRGGTDGSRLSFMGIPCPNIFTGGHNFHGPYEFIPVSSMEKAVSVIINIAEEFVKQK